MAAGEIGDLEVVLFDDSLDVRDYEGCLLPELQTVFALRIGDCLYSDIKIEPKNHHRKSDDEQAVDLSPWPTLQGLFTIVVSDLNRHNIDNLLTGEFADLLATQPQHTVQLESGWLMFFAEGCAAEPKEIDRMIERCLQIAECIAK